MFPPLPVEFCPARGVDAPRLSALGTKQEPNPQPARTYDMNRIAATALSLAQALRAADAIVAVVIVGVVGKRVS